MPLEVEAQGALQCILLHSGFSAYWMMHTGLGAYWMHSALCCSGLSASNKTFFLCITKHLPTPVCWSNLKTQDFCVWKIYKGGTSFILSIYHLYSEICLRFITKRIRNSKKCQILCRHVCLIFWGNRERARTQIAFGPLKEQLLSKQIYFNLSKVYNAKHIHNFKCQMWSMSEFFGKQRKNLYANCLRAITGAILDPNHFRWSVPTFLQAKVSHNMVISFF